MTKREREIIQAALAYSAGKHPSGHELSMLESELIVACNKYRREREERQADKIAKAQAHDEKMRAVRDFLSKIEVTIYPRPGREDRTMDSGP